MDAIAQLEQLHALMQQWSTRLDHLAYHLTHSKTVGDRVEACKTLQALADEISDQAWATFLDGCQARR